MLQLCVEPGSPRANLPAPQREAGPVIRMVRLDKCIIDTKAGCLSVGAFNSAWRQNKAFAAKHVIFAHVMLPSPFDLSSQGHL